MLWIIQKLQLWFWPGIRSLIGLGILALVLAQFGYTPGKLVNSMIGAVITYSEAYGWLVLLFIAMLLTFVLESGWKHIWPRLELIFFRTFGSNVLSIETEIGPLPTTGDRVHLLQLVPVPVGSGGGGLIHYPSQNDGNLRRWPSYKDGREILAYRCQVTNYSDAPLFNVTIAPWITFKENVRDASKPGSGHSGETILDRDWPIEIPKIDPGIANSYIFYIVNYQNMFAWASLPNKAHAQTLSSKNPSAVRVITPDNHIMFFVPMDMS